MTRVCPECFSNSILRLRVTELRRNRRLSTCTFHPTRKGVPIGEVAAVIDPVLRANYAISSDQFGQALSFHDLLYDVTGADDQRVVQGIADALSDADEYDLRDGDFPFYGDDQDYELIEPDGSLQSQLWAEFRRAITFERRFFNVDAQELLDRIFDKVHLLSDDKGRPAFYALDQDQVIYRARRVRTLGEAGEIGEKPEATLAAPPEAFRRAGRMNAAGVGAFYAALDHATCISELRPPVGSLVCMAGFRPSRQIYVLDLTRFERPGRRIDIFAKNYASRTTQWAFMQSFQVEISKPVLPDDEHLEYVPSQAVAEYLSSRSVRWRGKEVQIEGLVFRSAQRADGRNLVLFGDATRVTGTAPPAVHAPAWPDLDLDVPSLRQRAVRPAGLLYVPDSFCVCSIAGANYRTEDEALLSEGPLDI